MPANWREVYLDELRKHARHALASYRAHVDRKTALRERQRDPVFAQAAKDAVEIGLDEHEEVMWEQGKRGNVVASIVMLKSHRPERFIERSHLLEKQAAVQIDQRSITVNVQPGAGPAVPLEQIYSVLRDMLAVSTPTTRAALGQGETHAAE